MDHIKEILQEMVAHEGQAMEIFMTENPECFDSSKPDWLFPRLNSFFQTRDHKPEIIELLEKLGNTLSEKATDNIVSELLVLDKSKCVDDAYVEDFIGLFMAHSSKDYKFQKLKSPYKTKGYSMALKSISRNALQNLAMKFGESEHPYILATLADCYILAGELIEGLSFLYRGAKQLSTYPHKYWNSEYGMIGAVNILQYLYKLSESVEHRIFYFKVYYLNLTRLIHIIKDKLILSQTYRNRAFLCRSSVSAYAMPILGINPDLLYISDLWYAHFAGQPDVPAIMTQENLTLSMTMYQNGTIYVNPSGGYKDEEDRTYLQIVYAKHIQSIEIGTEYLKHFKAGELNMDREALNAFFRSIENECRSNYKTVKNRILPFKN